MTFHNPMRADVPAVPLPVCLKALDEEIERLIALRDAIDGDPDIEPSLGCVPGPHRTDHFHWWLDDEREGVDEREPDVDDEPMLGAPDDLAGDRDQEHWADGTNFLWSDEAEDANEDGGDVSDDPHDDDELEHDPAEAGIADEDALRLFYGGDGVPTFRRFADDTGIAFLRPTEAARRAI